jgi:hypothetical protein
LPYPIIEPHPTIPDEYRISGSAIAMSLRSE